MEKKATNAFVRRSNVAPAVEAMTMIRDLVVERDGRMVQITRTFKYRRYRSPASGEQARPTAASPGLHAVSEAGQRRPTLGVLLTGALAQADLPEDVRQLLSACAAGSLGEAPHARHAWRA